MSAMNDPNHAPEAEVLVTTAYDYLKVVIHEREHPSFEARIAVDLCERWGMVAATPDGEDSAGRAKVRNLTPREMVTRACDTASALVAEFRDRGWMTPLPSLADVRAEAQAQQDGLHRKVDGLRKNLEDTLKPR